MDKNEYISSGILETYVLGIATAEESAEVERMAALHPEIKTELEAIEDAVNGYASAHAIEPGDSFKENLITRISQPQTHDSSQIHVSYWSIAATFLFLVSAGFAVYFGMRNKSIDRDLNNLARINTILTDSMLSLSSNQKQMENDLAILKDPMYKMVELKGMKAAPDAKAMVCWCPMEKKVYVEADKLPPAPAGMQYQLWAFVDGKPVSEGMLTPGAGLHRMPDVDNAQGFAVTLEKQGGSLVPQGEMYVMGTI